MRRTIWVPIVLLVVLVLLWAPLRSETNASESHGLVTVRYWGVLTYLVTERGISPRLHKRTARGRWHTTSLGVTIGLTVVAALTATWLTRGKRRRDPVESAAPGHRLTWRSI